MSTRTTIGIVAPQLSGFYFGSLLTSINAVTQPQGMRLLAFQATPEDVLNARAGLDHVAGWIVINATQGLAQLADAGRALVTIGAQVDGLSCPAIVADNYGGAGAAVRHLIEHRHERIAFVGNMANSDVKQRYRGYCDAMAAAGFGPERQLLISVADNSEQSGASALTRLIDPEARYSAVFCATDENALGLLAAAAAAGCRIPEDLAVIGFDDIILAAGASPPLSTVRVSLHDLGSAAASILLAQIAGRETPRGAVQVPSTFISRRSCGCVTSSYKSGLAAISAASSWRAALTEQLCWVVAARPAPGHEEPAAERWPGAATLAEALEATLAGDRDVPAEALFRAWMQAIDMTQSLEVLLAAVGLLEEVGAWLLASRADDPQAHARVADFIGAARLELMRARLFIDGMFVRTYAAVAQQNTALSVRLLGGAAEAAEQLRWLEATPFRWGCLSLWEEARDAHARPRLRVVSTYQSHGVRQADGLYQTLIAPEAFPPLTTVPAPEDPASPELVAVLPLRSAERSWGLLALSASIAYLRSSGNYDTLGALITLLSAALERSALEAALRNAYEHAQALAGAVRELSTPVIPLFADVLLVPLIGSLGVERLELLIEILLQSIGEQQARVVLLDLTGVPLVDTHTAMALIQLTRAAGLLGARVILVGIRPEIAQSIVALGISLDQIETRASLASALDTLQRRR